MHGFKERAGENAPVDRHVLAWRKDGTETREFFHDAHDLAIRVARLDRKGVSAWSVRGPGGAAIAREALLDQGKKHLAWMSDPWGVGRRCGDGPHAGYARRAGPVVGTACSRGGGGYFRHIASIGAKKQSQAVPGEDEPKPRAARSVGNIPDAWDDYARQKQRSWKSQRRGAKAWERGGKGSLGKDRWALAWLLANEEGPIEEA